MTLKTMQIEIEALRDQVKALMERIEALEAKKGRHKWHK